MRTSSDPARARASACFAVAATSAVSVFVIDCTAMEWLPPIQTPPTFTGTDGRRVISAISNHYKYNGVPLRQDAPDVKIMSEQLHHQRVNLGWIEVICGSMFSGKSEELIRRLRRAQ